MTAVDERMAILTRAGRRPFPPRVSDFTRPFWDALAEGRLVTTCCRGCGRLSFPPKPVCRECWSQAYDWRPLSTAGTLYSFTRVHVVPGAFVADALYDIGIVDLAAGVRLLSRLLGNPAEFRIGGSVEMVVTAYEDGPLFAARMAAG